MGAYSCRVPILVWVLNIWDMVVVIELGAYIHGVLSMGAYYPDSTVYECRVSMQHECLPHFLLGHKSQRAHVKPHEARDSRVFLGIITPISVYTRNREKWSRAML